MKPVYPKIIYEATVTGTGAGAAVSVPIAPGGATAVQVVASNPDTLTSMDLDIQTSADGANWSDFLSPAQVTAAGAEIVRTANARFNLLRVNVDAFTGTSVDLVVYAQ